MIIYEGDSLIDGSPIVLLSTWPTANPKTGAMVQFWVLRRDVHPMDAIHSGSDVAVCGACRMRGRTKDGKERSCYVNLAVLGQIWKRYKAGGHDWADIPALDCTYVRPGLGGVSEGGQRPDWPGWAPMRFTAYGDAAAVPFGVWEALLRYQAGLQEWDRYLNEMSSHTGYTQHWGLPRMQEYKRLFHASVFSRSEACQAVDMGWRYYWATDRDLSTLDMVQGVDGDVQAHPTYSVECAHSNSGGTVQCDQCLKCSGTGLLGTNIAVHAHGSRVKHFKTNAAARRYVANKGPDFAAVAADLKGGPAYENVQ